MEVERLVRLMTTVANGRCLTSPRFRPADFSEFLKVIASQKTKTAAMDDESDTGTAGPTLITPFLPRRVPTCSSMDPHSSRVCCAVDAFIALGGKQDKSGEISTEKLRAVIKDFGLTIDIDVSAHSRSL